MCGIIGVERGGKYLQKGCMQIKMKQNGVEKGEEKLITAPKVPGEVNDSSLVETARYEEIARKLIMGQKASEIASDLGLSDRHVRRLLQRPEMEAIYRRVATEFYGDIDQVIKDEKLRPLIRAQAQAIRAQTLVTEVMDEVRDRITDGRAKATDLKVGADVAFGIMDRAKGDLSIAHGAGGGPINVEFNIGGARRALLRETIEEAGLDLSDLGIVDVESHPVEDTDGERTEHETDGGVHPDSGKHGERDTSGANPSPDSG
jgi:hypothetical protein